MRRLALAITLGAGALLGGTGVNAAENSVRGQTATNTSQITEFSSQHRRHHRHHSHRHIRHYGYAPGVYYAPQAYYAPEPYYYGGGPAIGFGFGGGHFGGHHGHHGGHH